MSVHVPLIVRTIVVSMKFSDFECACVKTKTTQYGAAKIEIV